jgi:glutathione S-transferase
MTKGEHKTPEYLKVHPHGVVPAIRDNENKVTMFESVAIVLYLAEKYNRLQPAPNTADRAQYLQWALYVVGTLEAPLVQVFSNGPASRLPVEKRSPEQFEEGMKRAGECAKV